MSSRTHAVVVAVEKYNQGTDFSKVHYAIKDAEDFIKSLIKQGVPEGNIKYMPNGKATKTSIETELKRLTKFVQATDKAIFYFAGHGAYLNKDNYIVPVDGYRYESDDTCISIDYILGLFKESRCQRNILFIDCCHSGFIPGNAKRDINDSFLSEELLYKYRDEEYCVGFASCGSHQTSISDSKLQNGVWTHFLVKAMNGDADGIYKNGILLSSDLQSYLNKTVPEYVRINTEERDTQIPIMFGSSTDKFVVADLTPIFEERQRLEEVQSKSLDIAKQVSIESDESGRVKDLPGFQKYHKVPSQFNSATNNFVKTIGKELIESNISSLSTEIREELNYKRTQLSAESEHGEGRIVTPDFSYYVSIQLDENNPTLYLVTRQVTEIVNPLIVASEEFNKVFGTQFNSLVFHFTKTINIEDLIDRIEALPKGRNIKVKYDPASLSECELRIEGLNYTIKVNAHQISLVSDYSVEPLGLIEAFKETRRLISQNKEIRFIE